ncbi:MAG: peptide deformylase [Pseudomonadota bacterium]
MRSIVCHPDPVLYRIARPVAAFDGWLRDLFADMARVRSELGGCGIAAPQVGESVRAFLLDPRQADGTVLERHAEVPALEIVNPVILSRSATQVWDEEGCLSLPETLVPEGRIYAQRSTTVDYTGFKVDGSPIGGSLTGFAARAFQHEMDHLNGQLISRFVQA